jgi:hypothetical protein
MGGETMGTEAAGGKATGNKAVALTESWPASSQD